MSFSTLFSTPRQLLSALILTLALVSGSLMFTAQPAEAGNSWTTVWSLHGGKTKLQLCRKRIDAGWRVYFRIDNRRSGHKHIAGMSRKRGDVWRGVSARGGRISQTKAITFRHIYEDGGYGLSEPGQGVGLNFEPREIGRCGAQGH